MKHTAAYFRDKAVLVTGASSGIGHELAWQLGQSGAKLTLAARRGALLEKLADRIASVGTPRPLVANCDVTRDGDVERAVAESVRQWGKLDAVIANAGFGAKRGFLEESVEQWKAMIERYPDRINRAVVWNSANAVKG